MTVDEDRITGIADLASLAAVLEVCSEKPGNVSPSYDFEDTRYEDFLLGSIVINRSMELSARRGFDVGGGRIKPAEVGVGGIIHGGVVDVKRSHSGGNTHLGMLMLLVPLAAGAGMCVARGEGFYLDLRGNVRFIVENTSVDDALGLYDAILVSEAGGLGGHDLDVRREESAGRLVSEGISFYELMRLSADRDLVARELVDGMGVVFNVAYPTFSNIFRKSGDVRSSIVQTFLVVLSRFPDTLIARKTADVKARRVSEYALSVLECGGVFTEEGRVELEEFSGYLRGAGNKLNPGTTADIVAATTFLWLLNNQF